MLNITCPNCRAILKVPEQYLGQSIICNKCSGPGFIVSTGEGNPAPKPTLSLIAVDVETTGLESGDDEIVQLAGVKFTPGGEITDTFSTLVNPERSIPRRASALHGITTAKIKNAPKIQQALAEFTSWAGSFDYLVAHNAAFDAGFLLHAGIDAGLPVRHWKIIDTLSMAQDAGIPVQDYKLVTLAKHFRIAVTREHDASEDTKVEAQLFNALCNAMPLDNAAICSRYGLPLLDSIRAKSERQSMTDNSPATSRQLSYLRDLGAPASRLNGITRADASQLIDQLKAGGKAKSARQVQPMQPNPPANSQGCALSGLLAVLCFFGLLVSIRLWS